MLQGARKIAPRSGGPSANTFVYDTFRAADAMYIEMESNVPGSLGFEAYYWTKPKNQSKPKASFKVNDSVCTNGKLFFLNTSSGSGVKYLWDMDGSLADFETTEPYPYWPYYS